MPFPTAAPPEALAARRSFPLSRGMLKRSLTGVNFGHLLRVAGATHQCRKNHYNLKKTAADSSDR
jgi:hypothetical protein